MLGKIGYKKSQELDGIIKRLTSPSNNLFNKDNVIFNKTFDRDGSIIDDPHRWVCLDYIPVESGEKIYFSADLPLRVTTYLEDKTFNSRTGTVGDPMVYENTSSVVRYFRFSGYHDVDSLMVNRGKHLMEYEPYGLVISKDALPDMKPDLDLEDFKNNVINEVLLSESKNPYPPTIQLKEIYQGSAKPYWLSSDGELLFGHDGTRPLVSDDEWETRHQIGTERMPVFITGMRELSDGELLASTHRLDDQDVKAGLYKTRGFDMDSLPEVVWEKVLEADSSLANFQNSWGFSVYNNIVVISEYGQQGIDGSRYVYISEDNAETFKRIFDLVEEDVDGRPKWDDNAHIHTVEYDPYFNRIWVCVGDGDNSAVYYSDNKGKDWSFVDGSNVVQYTGIIALEDCVVFGSDRHPNGLYIYRRVDKGTKPKIDPWYIINDENTLTHVFRLPFRRKRERGVPTYFCATSSQPTNSPNTTVVMAFIDGKKANLLYESDPIYSISDGAGVEVSLGNTDQGNVILSVDTPGGAGRIVYRARAPVWE